MKRNFIDAIPAVMKDAVERQHVAGISVLAWKDGKEQFYHQEGKADIANNRPLERNTIFRLYSMSKPVTGAACMLLVERGVIDLLDPVSKYLPGFADQAVAGSGRVEKVKRQMTVHDLLGMTSGLPYGNQETPAGRAVAGVFGELDTILSNGGTVGTVELANRFGQCPLDFHPGDNWAYGVSADILGAVIEVAAGKPFGQFLHEEFFAPLGMKDTAFYVPAEKQDRLTKIYEETPQGLIEYHRNHLGILHEMKTPPAFESGGAGLVSTVDDYLRFACMLQGKGALGKTRIFTPRTVEMFTAPQLTKEQKRGIRLWDSLAGYSYGRLMRVMEQPGRAIQLSSKGEYGWDGWLGCYFCNFPRENMTVLMMQQRVDTGTSGLTRRIRNLLLSAAE